jgi:peptide/nickel transport system substrate-binding protein
MSRTPRAVRLRLVPALLVAALGAAACGGSSDAPSGTDAAGSPAQGGVLTYLSGPEVPGLDPVDLTISTGSGHAPRGYPIYDMLLKLDPKTQDVVPGIAQSMTSKDATTWTLALHPGVTFSDGTAFDAEAVKFNWLRHTVPATKSAHASEAAQIASMTAVDPRTLTIVLKKPNSQWPQIVAGGLPFIGSPTAIKAEGAGFSVKPVGAGPFVVEEWRRDDQLVLTRNPTYWGGKVPLDGLVIKPVPDEQQRLDTVASLDGVARLNSSAVAEKATDQGLDVHVTKMNGGPSLVMNTKAAPFDDVRVRKALWLTFDGKDYNDVVLQGTGNVPSAYVAPDSPYFSKDATFPAPDLAQAQTLIDAYRADKGGDVTFTLQTQQPASAEYLQSAFQTLKGVTVTIQQLAGPQSVGNAFAHAFQATMLGLIFQAPAPVFNEEFRTGGTRNFSQYSSPVVDAAIATAQTSQGRDEQVAAYATAQKQLIADASEIVLTRSEGYDAVHGKARVPQFWNDGIPAFEKASLAK